MPMLTLGVESRISSLLVMRLATKLCENVEEHLADFVYMTLNIRIWTKSNNVYTYTP
jgi:hypothetical protein